MCQPLNQPLGSCFARAVFTALLFIAFSSSAGAAVHTIALRGDALSSGEAFGSFSSPSLNNRGQVAFAAQLSGSAVTTANDYGYWIASGGEFHNVIREGTQAPEMPEGTLFGGLFSLFNSSVPLNDAGDIAVNISATQTSGVWVGNHQSLNLLAAQNTAAPGAQNHATFGSFGGRASLNHRGDVAFTAYLNDAFYNTINSTNYHDGLWVLNRNGPVATLLAGESAPALGANALLYGFQTATPPALNGNGEAALYVNHKLDPNSSSIGAGIWVASPSGAELRGVNGQSWPEFGPNATLRLDSRPGFNSLGTVVIDGSVSEADGTSGAGGAIFLSDPNGLSVAAFSGGPAPDTGGHVFQSLSYEASISSRGHITFYGAEWEGSGTTSRTGIWAGEPDDLQLIVRNGDEAPGTGATFENFFRNTPAINRFGQIAFQINLIDSPLARTNSLWATDLDGNLAMIARVGQQLEVVQGDMRTISSLFMLTLHGDDDGRPRSLNDLGQIAFQANFTDGTTGLFLSDAVAHLPGDYNGDGTVDSGDYVVWRKSVVTQSLIADGDRNGVIDQQDYDLMREFFGMTLMQGTGGSDGNLVPEPGARLLLLPVAVLLMRRGRLIPPRP